MFHKPQDLLKRTPPDGINRPEFLKQLVQEFRKTNSAGIILMTDVLFVLMNRDYRRPTDVLLYICLLI